jgi:hypothetical protein
MIPNLAWTIVFMGPVVVFCYRSPDLTTSLTALGVCLVPSLFPNSFYDTIQLSYIDKFAQNGAWINRYLRKKYPEWKGVAPTRSAMNRRYHQTYFYERFHFSLFLFYTVMTIYAFFRGQFLFALILAICNLFYNIYPNLLQQYVRSKLAGMRSIVR